MKRGLMIGIIIVVVLAIAFGIYYYSTIKPSPTPTPSNCAKAGEASSNPSLGPDNQPKQCCEGLKEISGASMEQFNQDCLPMPGIGLICSNCGNNICESWENKCNCPADCK